MPDVDVLLPEHTRADGAKVVRDVRAAARTMAPFAADVVAFAADLSRALRREPRVRELPALGALAFWIRPASLERLRKEWSHLDSDERVVRVPRGAVFHIPPTNVDTLFVYSWLLSALVGNANIVRLSPAAAAAPSPLLGIIGDVLQQHPRVAATTAIVTYAHDDAITAALSGADVRVIWGGDDTVNAIRGVPLGPASMELAFPDRFSMAAFDAAAVNAIDDDDLAQLAGAFYNDAYWFDQMGCASPRLVVWRGSDVDAAAKRLYDALGAEVDRRGYDTATGVLIAKLVHAADTAAAGHVGRVDWSNNALTVAHLHEVGGIVRDGPGGGLFYDARIEELDDLAPCLVRRDQTLTHFGFSLAELRAFIRMVNGRGIDRVVPVGEALTFGHHWDGYDLLHAFSRGVACR
ncbi:MAG TPA: acyl-CoA reductase [Acidimicrobiia bacterium]|nr:acyl-CoA reductase [Acidimicrobiia bacterium]